MDLFELSAKIELDTGDYEKSVKSAAEKAEDVEDAFKGAGKAADKAEDSFDDLGDTAKHTSKDTDSLGKSVDKSKDSFFGSIVKADLFTDALEKVGEMAMEVAQYIWGLDEATQEYRVSQGKLNTAFKTAGFSANTAKTAYSGLYRAVGDVDRATEAAQLLSQLAITTQDVASWTEIATGVVGTFGDSLPIESLIEAANETARTGKVVGTLADALNWAGEIGEDDFNQMLAKCETQEERVNLITETLLGTYSEAADTFEETSDSLMKARDAFLEIQDASSEAGQAIADLKTEMGGSAQAQFAAQGFFGTVRDSAKWIENLSSGTKTNTDLVREWLKTVETRIDTGSIEDATAAFQELGRYIDYVSAHPLDSIFQLGGVFSAAGISDEVDRLMALFGERMNNAGDASNNAADGMNNAADSANNLGAAMEPVIATAGGLAVEIEGTGMTAEEASSRLQTYTDATLDMFGRISEESEISYADAVANLEANIQATQNFADNLTSIAGALPPQLAQMFAAGGPQMYAGTVAMLAEANRGTDEGLTQINELWGAGGEAAVQAFITSLGMVPEGTENPATIVAAQMEEDTSMEIAAVAVVDRTNAAFTDAVNSAGFDSSGRTAMEKFIQGLESQRGAVMSTAHSIAQDAKREIDSVLNSVGGKGSGRAGGLDYVPYNGYPATLHAGEAVLTAREAKEWRSGNSGSRNGGKQIVINQNINTIPMTPAQLAAASEAYFEQAVWAL